MPFHPRLTALAVLGAAAVLAPGAAAAPRSGVVYALTNTAPTNGVAVYDRAADGSLTAVATYLTGGQGSGAGLGSQGALAQTRLGGGRLLFAVDAGSNEISTFRVDGDTLHLVGVVPSGGQTPISLTARGRLLYVLNAGGSGNVTGFRIGGRGGLTPLAGSTQALSSDAAGPAEVELSPGAHTLVVTEKNTNMVDTFAVDRHSVAGPVQPHASAGQEPFGFDIDRRGHAIVSEAVGGMPGATSVSSYGLDPFATATAALPTGQTAACWLVVTPDGRYAYVANTGSGNVTGLAVARSGAVSLLDPSGVSATLAPGAHAIDEAVTRGGAYLYVLDSGNATITGFAIGADGSLTQVALAGGLPTSVQGLIAR